MHYSHYVQPNQRTENPVSRTSRGGNHVDESSLEGKHSSPYKNQRPASAKSSTYTYDQAKRDHIARTRGAPTASNTSPIDQASMNPKQRLSPREQMVQGQRKVSASHGRPEAAPKSVGGRPPIPNGPPPPSTQAQQQPQQQKTTLINQNAPVQQHAQPVTRQIQPSMSRTQIDEAITELRGELEKAYMDGDEQAASRISVKVAQLMKAKRSAKINESDDRRVRDELFGEIEFSKKQMVARSESAQMLTAKLQFWFKNGITAQTCRLLQEEISNELELLTHEVERMESIEVPSNSPSKIALEAVREEAVTTTVRDFIQPLETCNLYLSNIVAFNDFVQEGGLIPQTPIYK